MFLGLSSTVFFCSSAVMRPSTCLDAQKSIPRWWREGGAFFARYPRTFFTPSWAAGVAA